MNDTNYHATPGFSFRFMVLILGALVLMAVDNRTPAALAPVRTFATMVVYPLLYGVDFPQQAYQRSSGFFSAQRQLAEENISLKQQVQVFSAQQQDLNRVLAENQRLRTMLNAAPRDAYTFVMAEIFKVAQDPVRGLVTLNKGSSEGVKESQVVLDGNKIYGQVVNVTPFDSSVMQLIDREHSIPVQNQRTGERGLANGHGRGMPLEIKNLPASSTVKEGDVFVSSGLGGLFPAGYEVAQVLPKGVEFKQGDLFATVWAMPLVDYEAVREVLLVRGKASDETVQPAGGN
ncbi:MAG: rod shape-determining protein MreC [Candidatus Thiothrix putei]|uniref:Cell shape-determining protein MreC n=1 Tax=Candidatus Thiothrix putei TaxID=3080811 RepID=A0AA95KKF0_9GAMM|nr:MAG: rod shape-determining protein MreC [Candidatus Thiothrix putei]